MNKRRLLKMADFVETIPPEEFDMGLFGGVFACGTVGCAMGWAAHKKLFDGLRPRSRAYWLPVYGDEEGLKATAKLFRISMRDTEGLFIGTQHNGTPKKVSANIRRYVATGELP